MLKLRHAVPSPTRFTMLTGYFLIPAKNPVPPLVSSFSPPSN